MSFYSLYKKLNSQITILFLFIFLLVSILIYINYSFEIRNFSPEFSDNLSENFSIGKQIEVEYRNNVHSLLDLFSFDRTFVTKLVRDENQVVNRIDIDYKWRLGTKINLVVDVVAVVVKNDKFFIGCISEKYKENFLVHSMVGNSNGEFYQEIPENDCVSEDRGTNRKLVMHVHPRSLFSRDAEERLKDPDSLSGTRLYRSGDFKNLRLLLDFLIENGFVVREIFVNDLKLVEFDLGEYTLKTSLEKEPSDTIADFEAISRSGRLQKFINEDKDRIEYVDLSFKDKVFYKLKNNTKIDTMSTTTNAKELLD